MSLYTVLSYCHVGRHLHCPLLNHVDAVRCSVQDVDSVTDSPTTQYVDIDDDVIHGHQQGEIMARFSCVMYRPDGGGDDRSFEGGLSIDRCSRCSRAGERRRRHHAGCLVLACVQQCSRSVHLVLLGVCTQKIRNRQSSRGSRVVRAALCCECRLVSGTAEPFWSFVFLMK